MIELSRRGEDVRTHEADEAGAPAERASGAPAFWDAFARHHGRELTRVVACAMTRLGLRPLPDQVEELVQEVYCRLLAGRASAVADRPPAQLWAYLHRIARSVAIDELRSRRAGKRGGGRIHEQQVETLVERPAPGASPEERLLAAERTEALRRRVRQLYPGAQGERNLRVLELAALEGLTSAEISRRLGGELSPSSVHTVLHRLRRHLAAPPRPERAAERPRVEDEVVTSPMAAVG